MQKQICIYAKTTYWAKMPISKINKKEFKIKAQTSFSRHHKEYLKKSF